MLEARLHALFSFIRLLPHDNLLIKHFSWSYQLFGLNPSDFRFALFPPPFMADVGCMAALHIVFLI